MSNILYIGKFIGFAGGIERYIYQTAGMFENIDYAGLLPARGEEQFRGIFRKVYSLHDEIPADYDVVILHKLLPLKMMSKLYEQFGSRLVFMVHDHDLYCPRRHYYTPFGRRNCHRAYHPLRCTLCSMMSRSGNAGKDHAGTLRLVRKMNTAVISDFMQNNLIANGFAPEKIYRLTPVCKAGIARNEFMPSGVLRLLFLGQLIRGKGCDLLIDALRLIPEQPWRLTIAGDGNDRQMLERMVQEYGLTEKITFAGWNNSPEDFFAQTDLTVFPSRWQEPFGLSGLESIAHGVPVAAFDVGGVREWLSGNETGFMIPEQNLEMLAETIRNCSAEELKTMSRKCVAFADRNFSARCFMEKFAEMTEALK